MGFWSDFFADGTPPDTDLKTVVPATPENARIEVMRIGIMEDDLAYNERRGIYLIHDKVTGKEFVGVSGIGISELGSHTEGTHKHRRTVPDER